MLIDSTTNWNWLLEKSKKKSKNNDNKKLNVVINKVITLSLYITSEEEPVVTFCIKNGLHKSINTPKSGIINNENKIINIYNSFLCTYLGLYLYLHIALIFF